MLTNYWSVSKVENSRDRYTSIPKSRPQVPRPRTKNSGLKRPRPRFRGLHLCFFLLL